MAKKATQKETVPALNMRKESFAFLQKYLNNASPTGFESSGQALWLEYIKPFVDTTFTDTYGTSVGVVNPAAKYKVVIEAHADEISWFVSYINDDGYIYLKRNGGSDHMIAPSKRVNIFTKNGPVKAVFGWPAIHVRETNNDTPPSLKNIFLDCGAKNREEVHKMGVHVGCVAVFDDEVITLNNRLLVGRALDNRIGGFMIAEVARKIKESKKKPGFGLYVVNSVQEEIGLRGAEMIARNIKPNLAIITDVTHDTQSPMYNKVTNGDISVGKGPVVTYGPAVHNRVLDLIIDTAEKKKIQFQRQTVSRSTGTDTDSFAYSNEGVASALISLPLKYMHTTVETVHFDDVANVIDLIYETLMVVKPGQEFKYL